MALVGVKWLIRPGKTKAKVGQRPDATRQRPKILDLSRWPQGHSIPAMDTSVYDMSDGEK